MFFGLIIVLAVLATGIVIFLQHPKFGKLPEGDRLARIQHSPNYENGEFKNQIETPLFTTDKSFTKILFENASNNPERLNPEQQMPVEKPDFKALDIEKDIVIWLGHSSFFVQIAGKRCLIDPVFSDHASPVSFAVKAYKGTSIFSADDMPEIDCLMITHDHWDHLDYDSLIALKPKVKKAVVSLGLGSYLESWGYDPSIINEGDWYDQFEIGTNLRVHVVPARHYSGRMLKRRQTLWAGFILQSEQRQLFFSGDSGYGPHFAELGARFDHFDFAALDNGQYDMRWANIHMTPEQAVQAALDLHTEILLPAHVGRFTLAKHNWDEPFERVAKASAEKSFKLVTPLIGEAIELSSPGDNSSNNWWSRLAEGK